MTDTTWNHLRMQGRSWRLQNHHPRSQTLDAIKRGIARARREGATWQEVADAAMLSVSTVRKYGKQEVAA